MTEIEIAADILRQESSCVLDQIQSLDETFLAVIHLLAAHDGTLILSGMGKSGAVGRKIAATFSSLGKPSTFLHPTEALHGDVGVVRKDDIFLLLSHSGTTSEIVSLARWAKDHAVTVVSITSKPASLLASLSTHVIRLIVEKEAGFLHLAPTSSTTATLALGDALAMAVAARRGFSQQSFLRLHPAGALGERLRARVSDIMQRPPAFPISGIHAGHLDLAAEMNRTNLGIVVIVDEYGKLDSVFTDGDLRRTILHEPVATKRPITIHPDESSAQALRLMEQHSITALVVIDETSIPIGLVQIHDVLGRTKFMV